MSIKVRKNKRVKFGLFKSEKLAQEEIEKRREDADPRTTYHVLKVQRNKDGKNSWLAYCLIRKKGR